MRLVDIHAGIRPGWRPGSGPHAHPQGHGADHEERRAQRQQPKLPEPARRSIRRRYTEGGVSLADPATEHSIGRSTIRRIIQASGVPGSRAQQRGYDDSSALDG
jgi:hypothetical protein